MGNGRCGHVTNPHLKSKSQANFDYFIKWAKVILMAIQTATTIITKLVKVFSNYGLPEILLVATSKVVCYNKHWMHLVKLNHEKPFWGWNGGET